MHRWPYRFTFDSFIRVSRTIPRPLDRVLSKPIFLLLFSVILGLWLCNPVYSQTPDTRYHRNSKFGYLTVISKKQVSIDDKPLTFAPAVRIYNDRQRLIRPSSLLGSQAAVAYLIDRHNDVSEVWVLTEDEVKKISTLKNSTPTAASIASPGTRDE